MKFLIIFLVVIGVIYATNFTADLDPEDAVNILGGTNSRYDLSHGNLLPLISRPWGFNNYAPQTDNDPSYSSWWFHDTDRRYFGLRLTHQPSPWISDYGHFLIKAYMPEDVNDDSRELYTGYSSEQSVFKPFYFATKLFSYGNSKGNLVIEFTPSNHGGILRATYPPYIKQEVGDSAGHVTSQTRRVAISLPLPTDSGKITTSPIDGTTMISGYTKANSGGVGGTTAGFSFYFAAAIYSGKGGQKVTKISSTDSVSSGSSNTYIDLDPTDPDNEIITIRFGTSLISADQALTNLQAEVLSVSFDDLKADGKAEWNRVLSRIQIAEPPAGLSEEQAKDLYSVFYTCLYRASLFPRQLSEFTAEGKEIHWSPYATKVEDRIQDGPLSTDSGFWDAWNTIYPLLTLTNRPQLGVTMQGWLNAYKEGGWLPKWASPGYRGSMIGTMQDVSLADAVVKNLPGFDQKLAYEAIRKDAFEVPPLGVDGVGRVCLSSYLEYGYVPRGASMTTGGTCYEIVSRTLNYLQSDYAVAQAAKALGYTSDYDDLNKRIANFGALFDSQTGFFRAKNMDGSFADPFDQFGWGGDYTEGGPWQYRFYVPFDATGLSNLYQSTGRSMCEALNTTMTTTSLFHLGGYSTAIHEQIELPSNCFGQYDHGNQPAHHLLYMHMFDGYAGACSNQGRYYIRKTLLELYSNDANMFPGDEDNGEMSAWFVLSSLGLYERSPGSADYELGIPLFGNIVIDISDDSNYHSTMVSKKIHPIARLRSAVQSSNKSTKRILQIITRNNSVQNTLVEKILFNGEELPKNSNSISYALLSQGGTLEFIVGPSK
jgi:predicted alpha-1,2-mannosidase